jgi:hypothetical protein
MSPGFSDTKMSHGRLVVEPGFDPKPSQSKSAFVTRLVFFMLTPCFFVAVVVLFNLS